MGMQDHMSYVQSETFIKYDKGYLREIAAKRLSKDSRESILH